MPRPPADELRGGDEPVRSDKPDLRFGCELTDVTEFFEGTGFGVFQAPHVGAVVMPGGAAQTRRELDGWQEWALARRRGFACVLIDADRRVSSSSPVARHLSDAERAGLPNAVDARAGDCVFFAAGTPAAARSLLGAARLEIGQRCDLIDRAAWAFTWVVDAPMFEEDGSGGWTAVHHPFTAPLPEWADKFAGDPESALADAYDIVCSSNEIGGGVDRIHRADHGQVFDVIGAGGHVAVPGSCSRRSSTGRRRAAVSAFGWDRIMTLLARKDTIRDVIAFPKAASGLDPLTGAPTPITPAQRREAGIDAKPAQPSQSARSSPG